MSDEIEPWDVELAEVEAEYERLGAAVDALLELRHGQLPTQGWLPDRDTTRRCLETLANLRAKPVLRKARRT
jgi:hypothetical protein